MTNVVPDRLRKGDEIRVIAPSFFPNMVNSKVESALKRLRKLGYIVTFSKNLTGSSKNDFGSTTIERRVEELHNAFLDKNVKAILPITGGYNANQLLRYIDYDLISKNPKIFIGYSDITVLNNAIYSKTGLITYSGPNFHNFGVSDAIIDYTLKYFESCVSSSVSYIIHPSSEWIDNDNAYSTNVSLFSTEGLVPMSFGQTLGNAIGGNLCTFNLLQGTEYMPSLKDAIIFIEDDHIFNSTETFLLEFERNLQSLIHQPDFNFVKGIVIGRFEARSGITIKMLKSILENKRELVGLPVILNACFGHTSPAFTFPVGGRVEIKSAIGNSYIKICKHYVK